MAILFLYYPFFKKTQGSEWLNNSPHPPENNKYKDIVLVFYCYIMNYHKFSSLKHHPFIDHIFVGQKSGHISLGLWSGYHKAEIKVLARLLIGGLGKDTPPHSLNLLEKSSFLWIKVSSPWFFSGCQGEAILFPWWLLKVLSIWLSPPSKPVTAWWVLLTLQIFLPSFSVSFFFFFYSYAVSKPLIIMVL